MERTELTDKITVDGDVLGFQRRPDGYLKTPHVNLSRKTAHTDLAALKAIKMAIRTMQAVELCTSVEERVHPIIRPTNVDSSMAKLLMRAKFT